MRAPDDSEKTEALHGNGALNPRPQTVTDKLFHSHEFFDARDLVQVKYEMLRRVRVEGQSVTETAAAFGLSRPTFYQAQDALDRDGLPGLLPERRGPRGAHKLTDEVVAFLEQARDRVPRVRSLELARMVEEQFNLSVHPRSIERALTKQKKKRLPL